MLNQNQLTALQYVKRTGGGATKANFIDDHEPIGELLWGDISGMVREDHNGRIWLTGRGELELSAGNK